MLAVFVSTLTRSVTANPAAGSYVLINAAHSDVLAVSLTPLARASLQARAATMTLKYGTRIALKDQLGDAAHREDPLLGGLVRVMLFVLEQADTRSWETLPGSLALVQLSLEPGLHNVSLTITSRDGYHTVEMPNVDIRRGYPTVLAMHLPAGH